MEHSGGLFSMAVYLAILAFAVAWFLPPRWLQRRKANRLGKARQDGNGQRPVSSSNLR
jgi:hypothetical protein